MMKRIPAGIVVLVLGLWGLGTRGADAERWIDSCDYASNAEAAAKWQPMRDSEPAEVGMTAGQQALRLRCRFAGNPVERASWDRSVRLDLSNSRGIQFQVFCANSAPVSAFTLYFQTGDGWYSAPFDPDSPKGWGTLRIEKGQMQPEGKPGGWDEIKTIRISAWRAGNADTEFFIRDLRKLEPPPSTPEEIARYNLEQIGAVASYNGYEQARRELEQAGRGDPRVTLALAAADQLRAAALEFMKDGRYSEVASPAAAARRELIQALCLAQTPVAGEFRGFWCHSAFGVKGYSWEDAVARLAQNGFTAVLPNMLWGGVAFFDSKVLPVSPQVAARGDQLRECIAACRKHGLQVHVWKVNWNLGYAASKSEIEKMRREKRLQMSRAGKEEPWLCPSHPANQQLEIDSMIEVARDYDVDGLHFDYIRYPNAEYCFCAGCRERFEEHTGQKIRHWPEDMLAGGSLRTRWLEWRRSHITRVVRDVSQGARALKPKIQISAAVFRHWETDRDQVGQDWKIWCDKGYLDFVCPMDYTPSLSRFENMVARQVGWAGKVPCYPGLGPSAEIRFGPDRVIEEINAARRLGAGGFVVFNYGVPEYEELVPLLGIALTNTPARVR